MLPVPPPEPEGLGQSEARNKGGNEELVQAAYTYARERFRAGDSKWQIEEKLLQDGHDRNFVKNLTNELNPPVDIIEGACKVVKTTKDTYDIIRLILVLIITFVIYVFSTIAGSLYYAVLGGAAILLITFLLVKREALKSRWVIVTIVFVVAAGIIWCMALPYLKHHQVGQSFAPF